MCASHEFAEYTIKDCPSSVHRWICSWRSIPGIERQEQIQRWTDDGQSLIVYSANSWEAHIYRVDVATGKRTLLQNIELSDKAGSRLPIRLAYAERSKTYAYSAARNLGILYVVEWLQ